MHTTTPLFPNQPLRHQLSLRSLQPSNISRYALDYVLFLPGIWLAVALSVSMRLIGPAFIVIPTGFCVIYAILLRVKPPRVLSLYFAFCIGVALLSWYDLFPDSWQVHFMQDAIVRQLVPLAGFVAVAWASKAYFRRRLKDGTVFSDAQVTIVLGTVVAPILMYQQNAGYQGDHSAFAVMALAGAFTNNMSVTFLFLVGVVFFTKDWRRYAAVTYVIAVAATTHFAQFRILTIILLAALCGFPGRRATIGGLAALVIGYAIGMHYIPEAVAASPNDGLRLQLVYDAFVSAIDTHGMGVGYGKESVRWVYRFPDMPDFTFLPDPATMSRSRMLEALSTGVENSFAEALLRSGVLGCFLLLLAFLIAFPPRNLPRNVRNHAAVLYFLMFAACFVNSALESPITSVGIGFIYGYLIALRARARICVPQIEWYGKPA